MSVCHITLDVDGINLWQCYLTDERPWCEFGLPICVIEGEDWGPAAEVDGICLADLEATIVEGDDFLLDQWRFQCYMVRNARDGGV